ncbi:hypothetical protein EGW08_005989 [Elysia chlorotica]|uniref:Uncharacterized protein n=1 Tax=Elysia chlorotica TaxID=188477 RepID=A0A3S0ZUM4_ELYCH|nr:hypothetical protein EGW08_005989 [Elysia chlorotica]
MSSPEKSESGSKPAALTQGNMSSPSPRLAQRTLKLNPVSAPGFKPVPPPPTLGHREAPPLTNLPCPTSTHRRGRQTHVQTDSSRISDAQIASMTRRGREKPAKLVLLPDSDSSVGSSAATLTPRLPSPSAHQNPQGDTSLNKGSSSKTQLPQSPNTLADKHSPSLYPATVFQCDDEGRVPVYESRSSSRGARIEVPPSRDSRSPSPMSRRSRMIVNTLSVSKVTSVPVSTGISISSPDERQGSKPRSVTVSSTTARENPLETSLLFQQTQPKSSAISRHRNISDTTDADSSPSNRRSQSKGATALSPDANTSSNKKSPNKIDINYSPASPLSPRKRQTFTTDTASMKDAFQDNYRFFLRGGSNENNEGDDNNNAVSERARRIFSPAPVRDIFSPMPSVSGTESSYRDVFDCCADLNLPSRVISETKRGSAPGIVFPAIKVENVDDKTDKANLESGGSYMISSTIGISRRSRSITSSSGSSTSTSPSPTTPPPVEFSRFTPIRAKSTNTLLSPETSKLIDVCLSPALSPMPPPGSSPSLRPHPEDARLNWRKSGSSSTSCLLSVPSSVIKRQTSEGRLVVGVPDALAVPGENGAAKKGMRSRGWSRSESNLFVRTGRPVGGAGQGGLTADEDLGEGAHTNSS